MTEDGRWTLSEEEEEEMESSDLRQFIAFE
jgi:hypothetical protein